nr:MAG TPA: hypothetical protein [Microviridae sp.]
MTFLTGDIIPCLLHKVFAISSALTRSDQSADRYRTGKTLH